MPLPPPAAPRQLSHVRRVTYEVYRRDDGLWDVEGHLTDHRNGDIELRDGVRKAGEALHSMWLRVTIDQEFNILQAVGNLEAVPYPGTCESIGPDYARLEGLNLMQGFRAEVRKRFGSTSRCTHINELAGMLPTAAVQGRTNRDYKETGEKPFPIDQCHAQRSDGEIVRLQYPKWYRAPIARPNE